MQVVATAGHVEHGKSTLVRALTGMEPGRLPGDGLRGPTAGLGFAWTGLPSGRSLAFVDVPGHERHLTSTLAGIGSAPALMMVVAADEGWMPQSEAHLVAAHAFGVRHGLLVVTRSDLADPTPALRQATARIERSGLGPVESVIVSAASGTGLDGLTAALDRLAGRLPAPDPAAPVRLWIDRRETADAGTAGTAGTAGAVGPAGVTGASHVAGTLTAGTLRVGDSLLLGDRRVRVCGIESLGRSRTEVSAIARVVVGLHGAGRAHAGRAAALVTPRRWTDSGCVDVRLVFSEASGRLSRQLLLHIGAAAVPVRMRPLGPDTARLTLSTRLPLHLGDRGLLRDPGRRVTAEVRVLDLRPPVLLRRGDAAARGRELAAWPDRPGGDLALRRRGVLRPADLTAMGCGVPARAVRLGGDVDGDGGAVRGGEWIADPGHWESLRRRLTAEVARQAARDPLSPGLSPEAARLRLGLPSRHLVTSLVRPPLRLVDGRIHLGEPALRGDGAAMETLPAGLVDGTFRAAAVDRPADLREPAVRRA